MSSTEQDIAAKRRKRRKIKLWKRYHTERGKERPTYLREPTPYFKLIQISESFHNIPVSMDNRLHLILGQLILPVTGFTFSEKTFCVRWFFTKTVFLLVFLKLIFGSFGSFPRSSVGMQPGTLQRPIPQDQGLTPISPGSPRAGPNLLWATRDL